MRSSSVHTTSRLIQLSDCHLGEQPGERLLGLDTDRSLKDVLELVRHTEQGIDLVVNSGDVASGGQAGAYRRYPGLVSHYLQAPQAWLPGNHDRGPLMRDRDVQVDRVELPYWQVILLDSSVPGYEHGELAEEELQRLRAALQSCSKPALVFVHHQPLPVGSDWIDQYTIRNGDRLLQLLDAFPQVRGLVWGHVHQAWHGQRGHYQLLATPSTCIQFKPGSHDFALDTNMPGYRWFELYADGTFDTGVERVAARDYGIDFSSSGY